MEPSFLRLLVFMDILIVMAFAPADGRRHNTTANCRRCQERTGPQNPPPLSRRSLAKADETEKIFGVHKFKASSERKIIAQGKRSAALGSRSKNTSSVGAKEFVLMKAIGMPCRPSR
jgi:hypothetical protein